MTQPTVDDTTPGQVVLGAIRKQAEKASKPHFSMSSAPVSALGSYLEFLHYFPSIIDGKI